MDLILVVLVVWLFFWGECRVVVLWFLGFSAKAYTIITMAIDGNLCSQVYSQFIWRKVMLHDCIKYILWCFHLSIPSQSFYWNHNLRNKTHLFWLLNFVLLGKQRKWKRCLRQPKQNPSFDPQIKRTYHYMDGSVTCFTSSVELKFYSCFSCFDFT